VSVRNKLKGKKKAGIFIAVEREKREIQTEQRDIERKRTEKKREKKTSRINKSVKTRIRESTTMMSDDDDEPILNIPVETRIIESTTIMSDVDDEPLLNIPVENANKNRRCPTCQGTGSVSQSPGLVALIPLDDVRLKRRYTFVWIILTIMFCTLAASAVIAVLLPRSLHLSIQNPLVIDATNDTSRNITYFRLKFYHHTTIKSDNWVPIRLINLTTSVEHQLVPIGPDAEKIFGHKMFLRPLGTIQSNMTVQLDFDTTTMAYRVCHGIFRQMLMFKLQTTLTYADFLLGRIQTTNNISYQYVLCNRGEWKLEDNVNVKNTTMKI
jgi:hypothetical protein